MEKKKNIYKHITNQLSPLSFNIVYCESSIRLEDESIQLRIWCQSLKKGTLKTKVKVRMVPKESCLYVMKRREEKNKKNVKISSKMLTK